MQIEGLYKWDQDKLELKPIKKLTRKSKVEVTVHSIRMGTKSSQMVFVNLTDYKVIQGINTYSDGIYTLLIERFYYEFNSNSEIVEVKKRGAF